ncbi:MAG: hypothetical protein ABJN42_24605 [Roseibium sp.]|uniref:hypothetical protein n=1 Tax=Roseibium sp. TaxID=1936156 RepID=UPI0032980A01
MNPEKFKSDIRLLAAMDTKSFGPEFSITFLKHCTPAFGELLGTANGFMNYVSANQDLFLVPEVLEITRPALEAAIFISNCGQTYEWYFLNHGKDEAAMLEKVAPAMQCAAIMAPKLAETTSACLKVVNDALAEMKEKAAPAPAAQDVPPSEARSVASTLILKDDERVSSDPESVTG